MIVELRKAWTCYQKFTFAALNDLSRYLLKSKELLREGYAFYTSNGSESGFFSTSDDKTNVIAYVRILTAEEGRGPEIARLKKTLDSPDSRITFPVKPHHLTEYKFETTGSPGTLKFGCRLKDGDESGFLFRFATSKRNVVFTASMVLLITGCSKARNTKSRTDGQIFPV